MNVLITGASKGVGYQLAKEFANRQVDELYLVSRSADKLDELMKTCEKISDKVNVVTIPFDLIAIMDGNVLPIDNDIHLDIIINNAGLLVNKAFEELSLDDMRIMTETNFLVPARLIQSLLPNLGGAMQSHIVNIGSMGGFQGSAKFPGLSIYSATKAALASLTECLAEELADKNIVANCLALGAVQTEMLESAFPGYVAPVSAEEMARFIADFALNANSYINGKVIPVSVSTP